MASPPLRLAIIGCGGMGHRHMYGLAELTKAGLSDLHLAAVYDPVRSNAESLADQAAARLRQRPHIASSMDELSALGIDVVDITTTPPSHHTAACEALAHGWHVMVEKPMALTVRGCHAIQQAAIAANRVVSVAENYRRDPINRLARALIDAGVIGTPRLAIQHVIDGGDTMLISVWRHQKDQSGILIDVGVHYADMLEYLLGPIETVYAQARLHEPVRHNPAATGGSSINPAGVYTQWQRHMPASFAASAEDAVYATMTFQSGAVAQYIEDHAGHGLHQWNRQVHGSAGSLTLPNDRTGSTMTLHRHGQPACSGAALLELVPAFQLDHVTATLFGGMRLGSYAYSFEETDRKLLAIEYAELAHAIRTGQPPEVDHQQGMRAVAIAYAWLESNLCGHVVRVDEVLAQRINVYQAEIDH